MPPDDTPRATPLALKLLFWIGLPLLGFLILIVQRLGRGN